MSSVVYLIAMLLSVTATPAQSNSGLPVVDLGYVLQRVTTFNVSVTYSQLEEVLLLTAFLIRSIPVTSMISQISVTLSLPLGSYASKHLEAPRQIERFK